jgi:hypothetical protein
MRRRGEKMAFVECSEAKESQLCWTEVLGRSEEVNNQNYLTAEDSFRLNNNNDDDNNASSINFPCDFLSLCRVVNDLNAGFSILRTQVETIVSNLESVSKSNHRIHDKVCFVTVSLKLVYLSTAK